ncbi:hypothetical protein CN918_26280 [Priestia megaterium]|nr:hypothetical protein CN918_26280 [Priestia megaterium]
MSKQIMLKRLVSLHFDKNEFRFYQIETVSVGYNKVHVIATYGKLGTKGRENVTRFEGSDDALKRALKYTYNKIYEKKNEGYLSLRRVKKAFDAISYDKSKPKKKSDPTHLISLNFDKNEYRFYNVEVLSVGYNKIHVITSFGKLGTKGREQLTRFQDEDDVFKSAIRFSSQKIGEKKRDRYITKSLAENTLLALMDSPAKKKKVVTTPEKQSIPFGYHCDKCKRLIKPAMFSKIDAWARGEGNWDSKSDFKGKVFCLDCQFDLDIFKKKLPSTSKD